MVFWAFASFCFLLPVLFLFICDLLFRTMRAKALRRDGLVVFGI